MTSRLFVVTFAAVLSFHAVLSLAQSRPESIRFYHLKPVTPGENSAISVTCDGTTASPEVSCRTTQVMVQQQLDPKKVSTEITKRLTQLREETGNDPKKFTAKMCPDFRKVESKLSEIRSPRTKQQIQDILKFCAKPSMAGLEDWIRRETQAESRTCKVSVFENEPVTFKKVGPNKWVANVGPQGLCSSVYLYTMENDPKHTSLWKWSQVRTYADTSSELCKDTQLNYKLEYSWQGEDPELKCEWITFGS